MQHAPVSLAKPAHVSAGNRPQFLYLKCHLRYSGCCSHAFSGCFHLPLVWVVTCFLMHTPCWPHKCLLVVMRVTMLPPPRHQHGLLWFTVKNVSIRSYLKKKIGSSWLKIKNDCVKSELKTCWCKSVKCNSAILWRRLKKSQKT